MSEPAEIIQFAPPFCFVCKHLVLLAGRVAALLGDPFGELESTEEKRTDDDTTTTHEDARGHRVRVRRQLHRMMPTEVEITATVEGLPGGVTITFHDGDAGYDGLLGEGRHEIAGPRAAARAAEEAWSTALFELAAEEAELSDRWGAPPGWEARARACLRAAARARFERVAIPRGYDDWFGRFGAVHWLYVFGEEGEAPRLCAGFRGSLGRRGARISPVVPAPRGSAYAECVSAERTPRRPREPRSSGDLETVDISDLFGPAPLQPSVPARSVIPDLDVDALVAGVHGDGARRVQVERDTWLGHRNLTLRVQDDEGAGPAAFVEWRELGYREALQALFVGDEQGVRAAAARLVAWLGSQGWDADYGPRK